MSRVSPTLQQWNHELMLVGPHFFLSTLGHLHRQLPHLLTKCVTCWGTIRSVHCGICDRKRGFCCVSVILRHSDSIQRQKLTVAQRSAALPDRREADKHCRFPRKKLTQSILIHFGCYLVKHILLLTSVKQYQHDRHLVSWLEAQCVCNALDPI